MFSSHPALAQVLLDNTYLHAGFARVGAEPEIAAAGFKDILLNKQKISLHSDIRAAGEALKIQADGAGEARLDALKKLAAVQSGD